MAEILVVYTTLPDKKSTEDLAKALLEAHLAACVNFWEIGSAYWWKGKIEKGKEFALIAKTRPELERSVRERIMERHPYSTPVIMSWIWKVNDEYWKWLDSVVHSRNGPAVAVGALIEREKNGGKEVLLVKSEKWRGKWTMPGGHVEVGERVEDALVREVKEETNLDVGVVKPLGMHQGIFDRQYCKDRHFIFLDYLCKYKGGDVKLNEEGQDYKWVEPEKALEMDIDTYTRDAIKVYLGVE